MKGTNHVTVCKPKDEKWESIEEIRCSDPAFLLPAQFIADQLDRIVNLDNITIEGLVEKAQWKDRLKLFTQTILPNDLSVCSKQGVNESN